MAPTQPIITQPPAKFLSLKMARLMIGFLATESHTAAPTRPVTESIAMITMKLEPNQSASSPRSIITSRQPRPSAMRPRPMPSIGARLALHPRRILDQDINEDDGGDADRHVDEEDPAPGRRNR